MKRILINIFTGLLLTLAIALPAPAQNLSMQSPLIIDYDQWVRFANRAESVIERKVASNQALLELRLQIFNWQTQASKIVSQLDSEINKLADRIQAIDKNLEVLPETESTIENLKERLIKSLGQITEQYFVSEDIVNQSDIFIDSINNIVSLRKQQEFYSREISPLNYTAWPDASAFILEFFTDAISEIQDSVNTDTLRQQAINRLPVIISYLLIGLVLLTVARTWVIKLFSKIMLRLNLPQALPIIRLKSFIANVILPSIGIFLLVAACNETGLLFLRSQALINALPNIGVIIFGATWLANAVFSDIQPASHGFLFAAELRPLARRNVTIIGWIVALEQLVQVLVDDGNSPPHIETIILFPVLALAAIFLYRLSRILINNDSIDTDAPQSIWMKTISLLAKLSLIVAVGGLVFAILGFTPGSQMLIFSTISTLGVVAIALTTYVTCSGFYTYMDGILDVEILHYWRGPAKIVIGFIVFLMAVTGLAISWGATQIDLLIFWTKLKDGYTLGDYTISLTNIGVILLVFVIGVFITKLVQIILTQSVLPNTHLDIAAQSALTTGVGYIGIILSVVLALSLAGFNLTNVAIVAGALSVGIGFGLQAIVSNFVSGIILLIERPVREGDWIQTSGISGTVAKISVRSTHILTFDRATIIVPNSDLIAGQVTNWTIGTRIGRIVIPIGVAYGSDVERVLSILKQTAEENDSVTEDPSPSVAFMRFGADALEFEIRAVLKDVNYMISARSEINIEIERRFAEEGIIIPFAQRDIWIKNAEVLSDN